MLSREDNERLTRVGRGTPMGELCGATGSRSPRWASSTSTRRGPCEPKAVLRDPAKNVNILLPRIRQGRGAPMGVTPGRPRPMLWHAGQPREIAEEIERLWAELGGGA